MPRNHMLPIAGLAFALGLAALPAAAETDETIRAYSVWDSHGATYAAGADESIFSATLIGRFYIDTEQGPVDAGMLSCPATVHIRPDRTQSGQAICAITGKDGAQAFLDLSCTGVYMVGCSGKATVTGGTGRFKGVTGDGSFTIRSDLAGGMGGGAMNGQWMNGQMMNGQMMNGQMMNGQAMPGQMMDGQPMMNGVPPLGTMPMAGIGMGMGPMGMAPGSVGGILFFRELHYKLP